MRGNNSSIIDATKTRAPVRALVCCCPSDEEPRTRCHRRRASSFWRSRCLAKSKKKQQQEYRIRASSRRSRHETRTGESVMAWHSCTHRTHLRFYCLHGAALAMTTTTATLSVAGTIIRIRMSGAAVVLWGVQEPRNFLPWLIKRVRAQGAMDYNKARRRSAVHGLRASEV